MKLKAPKQITFWIAVAIAAVSLFAKLVTIQPLTGYSGWVMGVAFVILAAGNLVEGL